MKKKLIFSYSFLAVTMVLLVVGVFAWFSLSETSRGQGASIVATSKGVLKIYPESENLELPGTLLYSHFVNLVDFSTGTFADADLVGEEKSNISGDGETFFYLTAEDPVTFATITGDLHKYITFDLYFTGFSGVAEGGVNKGVYLTGASDISDVAIKEAVRVAFLDSSGNVVGIWAPYGGLLKFVQTGDTTAPTGTIAESGGDILRIEKGNGAADEATNLLTVNTGTAVSATQKLTVVMWIEGTAATAIDANLGQEVMLTLDFGMDTYA